MLSPGSDLCDEWIVLYIENTEPGTACLNAAVADQCMHGI